MKNENVSLWTKSVTVPSFPSLTQDLECDVLVIGGGIAGILAAHEVASTGRKVTLVDARKLIQETTANTTAKITAQHHLKYQQFIKKNGIEQANLYYQSQMDGIAHIEDLIDQYHIPCHFERLSSFQITDGKNKERLLKEKEAYDTLGIESVLHEQGIDLPYKNELALEMPNQAQFHPLEFLKGMIDVIKDRVDIYDRTVIASVSDQSAETEDGFTINFQDVIIATHYPLVNFKHNLISQLQIERSYIIATESEQLPKGMYQIVDKPERSLRNYEAAGSTGVLVGGENHVTGIKDGADAYDNLTAFSQSVLNSDRISQWSAQDMITPDEFPIIGAYRDHQYVMTGFNKFGMATAAMGAVILKTVLSGQPEPYNGIFNINRLDTIRDNVKGLAKKAVDSVIGEAKALSKYRTDKSQLKAGEAGIFNVGGKLHAIYKTEAGELHETSAICTHLGCVVNFNQAEKSWDCPCHGSRFDCHGKVLEGPATKDLHSF